MDLKILTVLIKGDSFREHLNKEVWKVYLLSLKVCFSYMYSYLSRLHYLLMK
jgi:hypothetical protein